MSTNAVIGVGSITGHSQYMPLPQSWTESEVNKVLEKIRAENQGYPTARQADVLLELKRLANEDCQLRCALNDVLEGLNDHIKSTAGNYILVKTFTIGQPGARRGYKDEPMSGKQVWQKLKPADWKPVITFWTIENTGFSGKEAGRIWHAGAMRLEKCETKQEGDHYVTEAAGRFHNWGDDGAYRASVRVIAVFVRK